MKHTIYYCIHDSNKSISNKIDNTYLSCCLGNYDKYSYYSDGNNHIISNIFKHKLLEYCKIKDNSNRLLYNFNGKPLLLSEYNNNYRKYYNKVFNSNIYKNREQIYENLYETVSFNISHDSNICGFIYDDLNSIGIDIMDLTDKTNLSSNIVYLEDYVITDIKIYNITDSYSLLDCFIQNNSDETYIYNLNILRFFSLKEAIVKYDGRGLDIINNVKIISINDNKITVNIECNIHYFNLYETIIDSKYYCCVIGNFDNINIKELKMDELLTLKI